MLASKFKQSSEVPDATYSVRFLHMAPPRALKCFEVGVTAGLWESKIDKAKQSELFPMHEID